MTFDLGEESMVGAHADIKAGMPGGAALTRDNVAGNHALAAIGLDARGACPLNRVRFAMNRLLFCEPWPVSDFAKF